MLLDIQDYDEAKNALENGIEELIPAQVVKALLNDENGIRVWRDFRGLSQAVFAKKAAISVPYLSQLETGKRTGSMKVLTALARALSVSLEELSTLS